MIEMRLEQTIPGLEYKSYTYYTSGGLKIARGFTEETGEAAAKRFLVLLQQNESEIIRMQCEYDGARMDNIERLDKSKPGKNWPIFGQYDRFLDRLQKQAHITDS
jgi:hypothetical protein